MSTTTIAKCSTQTTRPSSRWLLTPPAERDFDRLAPEHRTKVLDHLSQPFRRDQCKKVQQNRQRGLWRSKVDDTLRITFHLAHSERYVVHIGTKPEFENFVKHYVPHKNLQGITTQEFVMKNAAKNQHANQNPSQPVQAPAPVAADASERFRQAMTLLLQEVLVGAVNGKLDGFLNDLVRQSDRLDDLDKQAAQLTCHQDQQATQQNELVEDVEVLSGQVGKLGQALDRLRTQVPADLDHLRHSLDSRLEQLAIRLADEQAAARETRLDELSARLREEQQTARAEWSQALETVGRGLASLRDETRVLGSANQEALHTLNRHLTTEWRDRIGQVEDRLASAVHTIEELRTAWKQSQTAPTRRSWPERLRSLVRRLGYPLAWLKRTRRTREAA